MTEREGSRDDNPLRLERRRISDSKKFRVSNFWKPFSQVPKEEKVFGTVRVPTEDVSTSVGKVTVQER